MSERPDRRKEAMERVKEKRREAEEIQTFLKDHGDEITDSARAAFKAGVKTLIASADKIEGLAKELTRNEEHLAKLGALINPILEGNDSLPPFDQDSVSDDQRGNFMSLKDSYLKHGNAYALIDIFCLVVLLSKMSPPAWVLEPLARSFGEFIISGEGDPKALAKSLGLMGKASGKTPPIQEWKRGEKFAVPIQDMHALIESFGLKRAPAAEAVILKHGLSESVSTLKRYHDLAYADLRGINFFPYQNDEVQRTKFLSSFPPAALKIIRKKIKRNNI